MKMFGKKSLSSALYIVAVGASIFFVLFGLFVLITLSTGYNYEVGSDGFLIKLPFSSSVIKGQNTRMAFTSIFLTSIIYVFYFYVLAQIFRAFRESTIFSKSSIKSINIFGILNLLIAVGYRAITFILVKEIDGGDVLFMIVHVILAVFLFFLASIFKHGFGLQSEQDLTI